MGSNVIKDTFAASLQAAGFKKKGDSWCRHTDDAVLVANLQKSNFGEQYYVNLAVWLKALGTATCPKEHQCHLRIRATSLDAGRQRYWETRVFNLEYKELTDQDRSELIRQFLEGRALPTLSTWGSIAELRRQHREGSLKSAAILARAQPMLEG
jgi:hypothetical protein